MRTTVSVSALRFTAATQEENESGLLGWIALRLNGVFDLDGLALRRTRSGQLTVSFPARKDRFGQKHFYFSPADRDTHREIEEEILRALGIEVGIP